MLDGLIYRMGKKPPLDESQRASLALSSMYSILDGRADDSVAGNSFWTRQAAWNMLAGSWGIKGRTIAQKREAARAVLAGLLDGGARAERAEHAPIEALLAWDVARAVHVARRCQHAAFFDDDEAWQHILAAARLARPAFPGWPEYGAAFLRGRELWAGAPDARVAGAVQRLVDDPASIWRTTSWAALPG